MRYHLEVSCAIPHLLSQCGFLVGPPLDLPLARLVFGSAVADLIAQCFVVRKVDDMKNNRE